MHDPSCLVELLLLSLPTTFEATFQMSRLWPKGTTLGADLSRISSSKCTNKSFQGSWFWTIVWWSQHTLRIPCLELTSHLLVVAILHAFSKTGIGLDQMTLIWTPNKLTKVRISLTKLEVRSFRVAHSWRNLLKINVESVDNQTSSSQIPTLDSKLSRC